MTKLMITLLGLFMFACNPVKKVPIPKDYSGYYKKATTYCQANQLNPDFFILLDYGAHSGTERFMIYDFNAQKVIHKFPVSHGCYTSPWGRTNTKDKAVLSNAEESHASSKGKYLINERGSSQWGIGIKYMLDGLDETNSNARRRVIVLHSWEEVSDESIYPNGTPEGWGCPAISNSNLKILDAMLKKSARKTLLWAID